MARRGNAVRGRVLVVEQEGLLRRAMRVRLERHGFAVDAVGDAAQARGRLASGGHDVVVTGLTVGDADGLAIAAEARRRSVETQIVVVAGRSSKDSILRALRQGVADYIEKPFDLELLPPAVERALGKALVLRELVQLSRTDGLTGLANQRRFYAVLEAEIARARRQGHALSLLLVDVDDFKRYNDRHGHLAGDAALARVAATLRSACRRETDCACRYGGDEFMLILPEADATTAGEVAARASSLIRGEGLPLAISVGVAELRDGQDLKALIREADEAMYRNKARTHDVAPVLLAG